MEDRALIEPLLRLADEFLDPLPEEPEGLPNLSSRYDDILAHPRFAEFSAAAVAVSPRFGRLLSGAALHVEHRFGGYACSMGTGSWVVSRLIEDSARLAVAREQATREGLAIAAADVLRHFSAAMRSGTSLINGYVGLRGVSLSGTDSADIGIGQLRLLSDEEVRALSYPTWPSCREELCLVRTEEVRWHVIESLDERPRPAYDRATLADHEVFPLVLLLAGARNGDGRLRVPHTVWNRTSPYFFTGGGLGGGRSPDLQWRERSSPHFDAQVDDSIASNARSLFGAIASAPSNISTAARRLITACYVYNKRAEDRLIDAAISWEAALGSRERDQLSLQLALGLAWLLEPVDHEARSTLFQRAKKVYSIRSKLVHGGEASNDEVDKAAEELIEWLRRAFVQLVTTQAPLMTSKDRVMQLLLRDPSAMA